jgi:outer membrane protein OmpA-like peptidoglycan-associated protein
VGGLLLAPISAAMGQSTNIAYASAPRSEFVVFFDSTGELPTAASKTIHQAVKAARSADTVRITGRTDHAKVVKNELVRQGIPAESIVITHDAGSPLPKPADGLKDPLNRRVAISF